MNAIKQMCLASLMVCCVACKKQEQSVEDRAQVSDHDVYVLDGHLVFKNQKVYDSVATKLLSYSSSELSRWEKQFAGFESYNTVFLSRLRESNFLRTRADLSEFLKKYSDILTMGADSTIVRKFGTPLSAMVTNRKGEVKIGAQMRRYTADGRLLIYTGDSESNLPANQIKLNSTQKAPANLTGSALAYSPGLVGERIVYNDDNNRRLTVQLWYESEPLPIPAVGFDSRLYFVVAQELKRTFGGWRFNETDYYCDGGQLRIDVRDPLNLVLLSVSASAQQNVTGPIFYNVGSFNGSMEQYRGGVMFRTGGVPNGTNFPGN